MDSLLIPKPPDPPSSEWLRDFAAAITQLRPGLTPHNAMRCALLAHRGSWLLEPVEAAPLWFGAVEAASREAMRAPRGRLG